MDLVEILTMSREGVHNLVKHTLSNYGYRILEGSTWVCGLSNTNKPKPFVCSHYDTVNDNNLNPSIDDIDYNSSNIRLSRNANPKLRCLGGDDRAGIYIMLNLIKSGIDCHFGAFDLEETGAVGSRSFASSFPSELVDNVSAFIGLDRKGNNEFVTYNENVELNKLVISVSGFGLRFGSFSDVSVLSSISNVANVNMCVGYHNAHSRQEYIDVRSTNNIIGIIGKIVSELNKSDKIYYYNERQSRYSFFDNDDIEEDFQFEKGWKY